ncbi:hypothetical protein ABID59_002601 [Bradyrhizobium sp. S3.3.6]
MRAPHAREIREVPDMQALLRFVRFGLPWDFRTSITIARGGACPVVFLHRLSSPALCALAHWGPSIPRGSNRSPGSRGVLDRPVEAGHRVRESGAQSHYSSRLAQDPSGQGNATAQCDYRRGQINNVGKGMPAIPRPQGTRASANTSGSDSKLARRPSVELRSPYSRSRTERRKLVSSAGPDFDERARES